MNTTTPMRAMDFFLCGPRGTEKLQATQTVGGGKQWVDKHDLEKFIEQEKIQFKVTLWQVHR